MLDDMREIVFEVMSTLDKWGPNELAELRKQLEKQNEGKVKTTVTEQSNGMKKITKQQGNVSMEYYE